MTSCALAIFAAILPFRYGTPAEREILAEDRTFLAKAYAERNPDSSFMPDALTNVPHALSLGDRDFDPYIASSPGWIVPGAFTNATTSGIFAFSQPTNIPQGTWFPEELATNAFGIVPYVRCCTYSADRSLSLDWMVRAFKDVQGTRYRYHGEYGDYRLSVSGRVDIVWTTSYKYSGWSGQGYDDYTGYSTNSYPWSGYALIIGVEGTSYWSDLHADASDRTPYIYEAVTSEYQPLSIDMTVFNAWTNAASVWCAIGFRAERRTTVRTLVDSGGAWTDENVESNEFGYAMAMLPMTRLADGVWILSLETLTGAAETVAEHFGFLLSVPSLSLNGVASRSVEIFATLPGIEIQDLFFEANGDGWEWDPE